MRCDEQTVGSVINEASSWIAADLPAVVLCYRLRVSDKPVLEQLTRLLDTLSQWCGQQNVCASSARLLGLWLDKSLRRDAALAPSQAHKLKAHNAGGSPDIERLSGMF